MKNINFLSLIKNHKLILSLILAVFFLKGILLSSAFPIFGGQDESRHYNTVQYFAEPIEKTWQLSKSPAERDKDHIETYGFSDEIKNTATATDTDILRGDIFNTINFSNNNDGKNEMSITSMQWKPYNYNTTPEIVSRSIYHRIASLIEKSFSNQDILARFYLIRIFSVLLGTLAVFFFYFITKTVGLSSKYSLLLTAILSFQPKFSMYFANINYDVLLIPMFFLFTLAGVVTLKKGLDWKNLALLLFSMIIAIMTKPTGYILVIIFLALIAYLVYEKVKPQNKLFRYNIYGLSFFLFIFASLFLYRRFFAFHPLGQTIGSIFEYISKTITFGKFILPSSTYWGNLSWVNNWFLNNATDFIFIIEMAAIVGLGMLLFSRKINPPAGGDFLPEKKYVIFLIGMIVALQLGVRIADWNVFSQIGGMKMSLGTPGRYFLPNLASHIILTFTGLGALLEWASLKFKLATSGEKLFDWSLITGLILMFTFCMYLIFDVIIYRFYL